MGKRGPRPKPTALRVFEGQQIRRPSDREYEPVPPTTEITLAPCPDWLGEWGKAAWESAGAVLHGVGCLTDADLYLFAQWCMAHDDFHAARLDIAANGYVMTTEKGRQANPAVRIKNAATGFIIKAGTMFGMGPASRVGLSGAQQDPGHDDLEKFKRSETA